MVVVVGQSSQQGILSGVAKEALESIRGAGGGEGGAAFPLSPRGTPPTPFAAGHGGLLEGATGRRRRSSCRGL